MSEMVKKVAQALADEIASPKYAALDSVPGKDTALDLTKGLARAAIAAMRDPTKAMEEAADDLDDWGCPSDPGAGNASALAHWTAMIDEALKETP